MMFFITSFFSISPLHVRWLLPYIIKNNSNGKIKLITLYAVHLELITEAANRGVLWKKVF